MSFPSSRLLSFIVGGCTVLTSSLLIWQVHSSRLPPCASLFPENVVEGREGNQVPTEGLVLEALILRYHRETGAYPENLGVLASAYSCCLPELGGVTWSYSLTDAGGFALRVQSARGFDTWENFGRGWQLMETS